MMHKPVAKRLSQIFYACFIQKLARKKLGITEEEFKKRLYDDDDVIIPDTCRKVTKSIDKNDLIFNETPISIEVSYNGTSCSVDWHEKYEIPPEFVKTWFLMELESNQNEDTPNG